MRVCVCLSCAVSVRYAGMLEEKFGRDVQGTAAMLTCLLFGASLMLFLTWSILPRQPFLGAGLVFYCIYIWSRSDPFAEVVFYGFSFRQWHTPFLFLVMGILLGGDPILDLMGIAVGHAYYFLVELVPRNWGRTILFTPHFMVDFVTFLQNKWNNQPAPFNSAAPRPGWQQGAGNRLG